ATSQTYLQEGFDTEIPATWSVTDGGGATGDSWISGQQGGINSLNGTNCAIVDSDANGNGTELIETLTSPVFDTTGAVSLFLDFDQYYNNIGGDSAVVEVFDGTSWVEVLNQTADIGAFNAPDTQHIDITSLSNANMQVRFVYNDGNVWAWYWLVDNVQVYNSTCDFPSGVSLANITDTSADLAWTPGGTETSWEVVVQPAGTGFPTGPGDMVTVNPYAITGLTATTDYEVYLRADCGADGLSNWVGPIVFRTLNTPPPPPVGVSCASGSSSFVYTAEFDTVDGWTGDLNGGDGTWEIPNDSGSGGTGPNAAFSGGGFMNYEASGGTTATASAVSPSIDLTTAVDGAELSFYMHAYGADMGTLNVGVSTSPAGPFTNVFAWAGELQTSGDEAWVPVGVNLDAYLGQVVYVEFSHTGTGDFEGDMSIDLVRVETCGSFCIAPSSINVSNVGGTVADVAWTGNNGESSWEYVVVPAGTGEPTGSGTVTGTNAIGLTGLDFSTDYEIWVRADCGGGTFSLWAGPVNFTTTIQSDYTIDCTQAPTNITYCYGNNDTTNWTFTSSDGSPIRITFNAGGIESCCDDIILYEGTDNTGAVIFQGNNGGDLAGLTFDSLGDSIFMEIDADGSVSCASGSFCCTAQWDFDVACATCVNPSATYDVVSNCVVGPEFFVDVDLTDLGSATSITVSDDQGSAPQTVTAVGVLQFGPYANNTPVVITVANDDDANCEISSSPLTQE
ncbi:choice-of-anchor J domain-containing protein, partial [Psychroserpens sp. XS_ASV72]|uniref:fibronectin type III domain-containing protein n=1 Tax=Psychroserpens sp. XS_ASV72 TaxID=3241293 RepID=UPI003519AA60